MTKIIRLLPAEFPLRALHGGSRVKNGREFAANPFRDWAARLECASRRLPLVNNLELAGHGVSRLRLSPFGLVPYRLGRIPKVIGAR